MGAAPPLAAAGQSASGGASPDMTSTGGAGFSGVASGAGGGVTVPLGGSGGSAGEALAGSDAGGSAGATSGGSASFGGYSSSADDPGTDGDGTFQVPQPFKSAPEFQRGAGVPQGDMIRFTIPSSIIYPKAPARKIAAYVPKQYVVGKPAPVMVIQDGTDFYGFDGSFPPVFDNLIAQGKIPPMVVLFTGNGGGDSVGSERGLEYDTVRGRW